MFVKTMNGTAKKLIAGKKVSGKKTHPVLRGLSGPFAGQVFDLSKGTIVMGRDPATCHIVFEKTCRASVDGTARFLIRQQMTALF